MCSQFVCCQCVGCQFSTQPFPSRSCISPFGKSVSRVYRFPSCYNINLQGTNSTSFTKKFLHSPSFQENCWILVEEVIILHFFSRSSIIPTSSTDSFSIFPVVPLLSSPSTFYKCSTLLRNLFLVLLAFPFLLYVQMILFLALF